MKIFLDTRGDSRYFNETAYWGWENKASALWAIKSGYKEVADQLVDDVLAINNQGIREKWIFPILFCYRHSIESFLKMIYYRGCNEICMGHSLLKIWDNSICPDIIEGVFQNQELFEIMKEKNPDLQPIDMRLIPLNEIRTKLDELENADIQSSERIVHNRTDANADVWRYLISPDGNLYFNQGHWIHYPTLKSAINELYEMLDDIYIKLDNFLSV